MSLRALLDREYRISSVASGEAAVEELPRFRPDLVLLDVKLLPSMSGLDALRVHQGLRRADRGRDDHRLRLARHPQRGLRRGAFGYLIKPFPRRDLALMVRDALARRSGRVDGRVTECSRSLTGARGAVRISRYVLSPGRGPAGIRTSRRLTGRTSSMSLTSHVEKWVDEVAALTRPGEASCGATGRRPEYDAPGRRHARGTARCSR